MTHDPIKSFISCSHRDEGFREQLQEHLHALERRGLIEVWQDRRIAPGEEWEGAISEDLETAGIVLLLVSSSFIASPYCCNEADGHTVCMTRTTNSETLSNNDRYTYANTTGAKILVSIHMNSSSNPATDYTTTLFGKLRKDKELAYALFDDLSTLPAASGTGTIATRDPYSFASGVLLKSNMPATIAETVFITSDAEGRLLSDGTGARQQQIAEALEKGIEAYLSTH